MTFDAEPTAEAVHRAAQLSMLHDRIVHLEACFEDLTNQVIEHDENPHPSRAVEYGMVSARRAGVASELAEIRKTRNRLAGGSLPASGFRALPPAVRFERAAIESSDRRCEGWTVRCLHPQLPVHLRMVPSKAPGVWDAELVGPTGSHSLTAADVGRITTHWRGFLHNNGVRLVNIGTAAVPFTRPLDRCDAHDLGLLGVAR